jgi:hypothetical protein
MLFSILYTCVFQSNTYMLCSIYSSIIFSPRKTQCECDIGRIRSGLISTLLVTTEAEPSLHQCSSFEELVGNACRPRPCAALVQLTSYSKGCVSETSCHLICGKVHLSKLVHVYVCIYICMYIYIYVYIYILLTCIHTYIHT